MRSWPALVLLSACATPTVERLPWREVFGAPPAVKRQLPSDAELRAALQAFVEGASWSRQSVGRGAPMPAAHVDAWGRVLQTVEQGLARPGASSVTDVARVRLVLEGELEADAQQWGDLPVGTGEAVQGTLQHLSQRLAELTALTAKHQVSPEHFRWPVTPVLVTSPWGQRVHPITGGWAPHLGVDLAAQTAQPVVAAAAGTVTFCGWRGNHGKSIEVQHDAKWATRYSHLQVWLVGAGATVKKGQLIGLAGSTGQSTGVHLHFELLAGGEPQDPEALLPSPPTAASASMAASP